MRVQKVLSPGSGRVSWTVLDDAGAVLEPVERFLAYLSAVERSPNTVKAYGHDLKDWFDFLAGRRVGLESASLEDVAAFVAWLRMPPAARQGHVVVLPSVRPHCASVSVNRKIAALTSFYEFHTRSGVELAGMLTRVVSPGGRSRSASSFTPFLHHVTKSEPQRRRSIALASEQRPPQVLTAGQAQAVLDGCVHLRDRFFFALLLDTGVRVGEALGLRHEDVDLPARTVIVTPRENDNQARAKSGRVRRIPCSGELVRLYVDYLSSEYGSLDSDYVFVNLWGRPRGAPWTYAAVYDLVGRLRRRTGVQFGPHLFRHTYATWLLRNGAGMESVKALLGHASITTTIDTYGHLDVEDARAALATAGWFTGKEVTW